METIYNLLERAAELRGKRETGSVTPEEVGGLQYDTLAYVAQVEQLQKTLGVRRVYKTAEEMLQDAEPIAENGVSLKFGQLVMVFDEENVDCEENGCIYVYQAPGWKLSAKDRWVTAIEGVREEFLARLQGRSESSDPMADPFVKLSAGGAAALAELLDSTTNKGRYRVDFGGYILIDVNVFVRNSGVIVQSISGFIDRYDGGIDVAEKKNTFLRKGTPTEDAISWSEWVAVEGSNVRKITEENVAALNEEIARATAEEAELLARLQGTSEVSDAFNDPFKRLPAVQTIDEMLAQLDKMHGTTVSATQGYLGNFRIKVESADVKISSQMLGYATDTWAQEITAPFEIYYEATDNTTTLDNGDYYLSRTYSQKLRPGVTTTAKGRVRTLRRMCKNGVWGNWVDTVNPYITSFLYGKNVLLLGGSFAHNTRGKLSAGFGFYVDARDYSLQDYIAECMGLARLDNYAISGNGNYTGEDKFVYNSYAQLEAAIAHATANGYSYDAIILFGGINDYAANVPLGNLSDEMGDTSFCASLKKIINKARTTYKDVKLFFTTPFKGFHSTDAFFNPVSVVTNSVGHRFYEYVQAIKDVANYASIPLLDIFAIHQVDTNNYTAFTVDKLHPNGAGYKNIAQPLLELLAWGKGASTFTVDALLMATNNSIPTAQSNGTAVSSAAKKYAYRGTGDNDIVAGAYWKRYAASVDLKLKKWGSTEMGTQNLPAATIDYAGVMSAEDKQILTAMLESIATLEKRIAALEELHAAIEATVADNNLTLSGEGVEVADNNLTLPEDKVTLEDNNLIIN